MISIFYIWAKICQKMRGKAIADCSIDKTAVINSGSHIVKSSIGRYSYCGYDCRIYNCEIGGFCSIADNVVIGSAQHPMHWVSTSPVFENVIHSGPEKRFARFELPESKRTFIGSDVWIGHGVIIKAGVKIGNGAVIGAGAVVTKDVEPYSVVGGCPSKVLKMRFSEEIIADLLKTKWWELSDDELQTKAKYITQPEEFIKTFNI